MSLSANILTDSLFGGSRVSEMQRTYMWDLFMPFSAGGIPGVALTKFCQDVRFGEYGFGDLPQMRLGARQAFFAGLLQITHVTMTFAKPIPDLVSAFFRAWMEQAVDKRGFYQTKDKYQHSVYIMLEHPSHLPVEKIRLVNAFPRTLPTHTLSYKDESIVHLTVDLSVDRIERMGILGMLGGIVNEAKKFF